MNCQKVYLVICTLFHSFFCSYIEVEELKNVLKTLGEKLDDEDVAELVKTADVDREGKINYLGEVMEGVQDLILI